MNCPQGHPHPHPKKKLMGVVWKVGAVGSMRGRTLDSLSGFFLLTFKKENNMERAALRAFKAMAGLAAQP